MTPDSHVVLYDTQGVFSAPRGAYTFKRKPVILTIAMPLLTDV